MLMSISYYDAGVNIEKGDEVVTRISSHAQNTHNDRVLNSLGSFASLYDISGFNNPVLVSGTDGVGTKILLAIKHNCFEGIGQDCVAMCVNDILCHGAKPLFFLDYLACGTLNADIVTQIISGIANACTLCGSSLVGGETAEMPGVYNKGDYDVAGFVVGIVDKTRIIDGSHITYGDVIIGCGSNGLHSNGYSLVRAMISDTDQVFGGSPLYHTLLTPTRLYVNTILQTIEEFNDNSSMRIKGLAHITGGGITGNISRIIPNGLIGIIQRSHIPSLPIFDFLRKQDCTEITLWQTFNMGVGMVLVVEKETAPHILEFLTAIGEQSFVLGEISKDIQFNSNALISEQKVCLI